MNIDKYLENNGLTTNDVVEMLKTEFPKITKGTLSMVRRGTYGVVLSQKAVGVLNKAHPPKKENRKKAHKLTVRLDDYTFERLQTVCREYNCSVQEIAEDAIRDYIGKYF